MGCQRAVGIAAPGEPRLVHVAGRWRLVVRVTIVVPPPAAVHGRSCAARCRSTLGTGAVMAYQRAGAAAQITRSSATSVIVCAGWLASHRRAFIVRLRARVERVLADDAMRPAIGLGASSSGTALRGLPSSLAADRAPMCVSGPWDSRPPVGVRRSGPGRGSACHRPVAINRSRIAGPG